MPDELAKPITGTGSVRDHLASERTSLAWARTSIALLGFGVLIANLRSLEAAPRPTRLDAAGPGLRRGGRVHPPAGRLALRWTRRMIVGGDYRAAAHLIFVFAAAVFALGLASIIHLLTISR